MAKTDFHWGSQALPSSTLKGECWRLVENQEQIATHELVESLEEQALLEQLLDQSKPNYPQGLQHKHYLIATPFRYPPLPWGSRFGQTFERGLFYGSEFVTTALAEVAYYRLLFYYGMSVAFPKLLITLHTAFSVDYCCKKGADLFLPPFNDYQLEITHPASYHFTQKLGSQLREQQFDGLIHASARCPNSGTNIVIFTPSSIISRKPKEQNSWICELSAETVTFSCQHPNPAILKFSHKDFEINGQFPRINTS